MKKFLPYIFIAIVLVGLFSFVSPAEVEAQVPCTGTTITGAPFPLGCGQAPAAPVPCTGTTITGAPFPLGCSNATSTTSEDAAKKDAARARCIKIFFPNVADTRINQCITDLLLGKSVTDENGKPVKLSDFYTPSSTANPAAGDPAAGTGADGTAGGGGDSTRALFGQCFPGDKLVNFSPGQCLTSFGYWLLITVPSYILYITAYMFNVMLALTLGTVLYDNNFLPEAWRIIRDFSNIFFILILLYISIKTILGLGGAEIKRMVPMVIVAALLINFSMFMTKVVIDASNILALIFYNKIAVVGPSAVEQAAGTAINTNTGVQTRDVVYNNVVTEKNAVVDKDIAAGIVTGFNPARFINPSIAKTLNTQLENSGGTTATGNVVSFGAGGVLGVAIYNALSSAGTNSTLPVAIALAVEFTGAAIFLFAAFAFFIAALAFIGRLIELWILIIFSPFAFMSLSIPQLEKLDYLGWNSWITRLLSTAFMAPIFMFFLLIITKLIQIDIFKDVLKNDPSASIPRTLLILAIPAIIYLTLLYKAVGYAKEGAGEFGKAAVKYGTMATAAVGGLALGAATGGAGLALSGTLGRAGAAVANSKFAKTNGALGRGIGNVGKWLGSSSFDLRKVGAVSSLAGKAGVNLDRGPLKAIGLGAKEGGWEQRRKEKVEKRQKRAKELEVGEDEELKQNLNTMERDLQDLLRANSHEIEQIDKRIKIQRERAADAARAARANPGGAINPSTGNTYETDSRRAEAILADSVGERLARKNATTFTTSTGALIDFTANRSALGHSINELEDVEIPHAHHEIERENRDRKWAYAESLEGRQRVARTLGFLVTGGLYNVQRNTKAEREGAHKIIMEDKLDSGDKH